MTEIPILLPKVKLATRLFLPKTRAEKNPAVLFLHGWKSDQNGYAKRALALNELGYICLTMDLGGHGKSSGRLRDFSRKDHLEQVSAAYERLKAQTRVDAARISVVGSSYGGYLACLLAGEKPLHTLVLRVPALYADTDFTLPQAEIIDRLETRDIRRIQLDPTDNKALSAIAHFKGQILIIESEYDTLIPHQVIENLMHAAKDPNQVSYIMMHGADHNLQNEELKEEFIQILKDWFQKQ